jgi:hypothetical protein
MTRAGQQATEPSPFGLSRDAAGRLMLIDREGRRHENVRPTRVFPLTDPTHWIALRDERGQELALVEDPGQLPQSTRDLLLEDLQKREFIPRIEEVHSVQNKAGALDWHVETDRGPTSFRMESEDQIHLLDNDRVLLTDIHGVRFLIPSLRSLDHASRRKLERYI